MKAIQQRVIEIITLQAVSKVAAGRYINWDDLDELDGGNPPCRNLIVDEDWFWDNFRAMVGETEKHLTDAVEGWVTVKYEERIIGRIHNVARMFHVR